MVVPPLVLAFASALVFGPPKLPPVPGTGAPPSQDDGPSGGQSDAVKPAKKVTPTAAPRLEPTDPVVTVESQTSPASPTEASTPDDPPLAAEPSAPSTEGVEIVAPPEPSAGPWPEPLPPHTPPTEAEGDAAPPPNAPGATLPPGVIPGGPPSPTVSFLPPPTRPPFGGKGLFIAAGTVLGVAIVEQVVGHVLLKRNCIDRVAGKVFKEEEDLNDVLGACGPSAVPAFALRIHSDLALLAMIGLVSGGAALRGQQAAHDHVFSGAAAPHPRLRYAGIGLIGGGVVTWLSTSTGSWAWLGQCRTSGCVSGARIMGFALRDVSAVMVAAGAGLLIYAEAHRRNGDRLRRETGFGLQPSVTASYVGLTATGRF